MSVSHPYPTLVAVVCAVSLGSPCDAQVVVGRTTDRESGQVLANAYAALIDEDQDTLARALSDEDGRFVLELRSGPPAFLLLVQAPGYGGIIGEISDVGATDTLWTTVQLSVRPMEIEGVIVPVSVQHSTLVGAGFHRRAALGGGTFLTQEDFDRGTRTSLIDVLDRVPGIQMEPAPRPGAAPMVMLRAGVAAQARTGGSFGCAPMIYLDGVPVQQGGGLEAHEYFDLESIGLESVLGIEVYDSPAETPAIFSGGSAACGVIAIWLR